MDPIKEALTFDDVTLAPQYSKVLPSDVSTRTALSNQLKLDIPILSSAMDTVTESKMAIALAKQGGIGVIHRNLSISKQINEIKKVKSKSFKVGAAVGTNESELNRTTLTNGIDYVFSGKKIELQSNFVFRIFVDFDLEITQQQFESKAPKEFVDLQQQLAGTIGKDMKASAANFKAEDFALNGSPFNIPGETINGMNE